MAFKVIYTDEDNDAPQNIDVIIDRPTVHTVANMTPDAAATDPALKDGDYTNGEQYAWSGTFPKAQYQYYFEATDGTDTVRLPETGAPALTFTTGYSNVAFLPGIQASRLYEKRDGLDSKLWEPNSDELARRLSLNQNGESENKGIHTKTNSEGAIDEFQEIFNVYESFLDNMNEWKDTGLISDYRTLPYDWRLSFDKILNRGVVEDSKLYYGKDDVTNTPYILQELEELAESSDNGKVTIVAHSMGGLLAKKLLNDLENNPSNPYHYLVNKIDTVILVASPQLGTPKAIGSLLHGIGQGWSIPVISYDFVTKETARGLGRNMVPAYGLLPSQEYTERVTDGASTSSALVMFDSSISQITNDQFFNPGVFLNNYGSTITSHNTLTSFLSGSEGRSRPGRNDLIHPEILRDELLNKAQTLHAEIDNWQAPEGARVVQIAGWGIPETIAGVEYTARKHVTEVCTGGFLGLGGNCTQETRYELDVEPRFTTNGDGTVVLPSAMAMKGSDQTKTYFVDLPNYNEGLTRNRSHASITEVDPLRELIRNLIKHQDNPTLGVDFIATQRSELNRNNLSYLRLSLHSPVAIDIADKNGNKVGINEEAGENEISLREEIPNSYYMEFGEGKYLGVPVGNSKEYIMHLDGTAEGNFTLKLKEKTATTTKTQTFIDVPVSASTQGTITFSDINEIGELSLDDDGDGKTDRITLSEEHKKEITFKTLITELGMLDTKWKKFYIKKAEVAQKQANKENYIAAKFILNSLKESLNPSTRKHFGWKKRAILQEEVIRAISLTKALVGQMKDKVEKQKESFKDNLRDYEWKGKEDKGKEDSHKGHKNERKKDREEDSEDWGQSNWSE